MHNSPQHLSSHLPLLSRHTRQNSNFEDLERMEGTLRNTLQDSLSSCHKQALLQIAPLLEPILLKDLIQQSDMKRLDQTLQQLKIGKQQQETPTELLVSNRNISHQPSKVSRKGNEGKRNEINPRYTNIYFQPLQPPFRRNKWDMDIDYVNQSINELIQDDDDYDNEEFNEAEEEETDEEDNINAIQGKDRYMETLRHIVNNVLTDEQCTALRNGECFFCHKKGHFYCDCPARKVYLNSRRKKPMEKKHKPKFNGGGKRKNFKEKKVDPNTMVYNFEEDNNGVFNEYSNDGNF